MEVVDNGPAPFVGEIEKLTEDNTNYRTTLWTGAHLQVTLMSIEPGHDIGLEVHPNTDQFLRVEAGKVKVEMGPAETDLKSWEAEDGYAVIVPAGTWHNLTCIGDEAMKVYSIYAPAEHPHGTIHETKEDAEEAEAEHHS